MTKIKSGEMQFDPQRQRVYSIMKDRKYHTLGEIARTLGIPEQSASARVRDLRKEAFGGYNIVRRLRPEGYNEYRMANRI